ncbi:MAG: uroporphyrinogen-III synthase [Methylomonas sp.]|jgi:uroporphyrinogen-III synthase
MKHLRGRKILVTRPLLQAENLCNLIASQGGEAVRFPVLEISPRQLEPNVLQAAMHCDWLIFTSANAVDFAIPLLNGKMPGLGAIRIAAVGEATAAALRRAGWRVDCAPASQFGSEALLAEACLQEPAGLRCVIVRGVGGREKLAEILAKRGAEVSYLEVYKRLRPATDATALEHGLLTGRLDAVTITSVEALRNLLAMVNASSRALLTQLPLIVVSDRIGQAAVQLGFKRVTVSQQPADAAILDTLTSLFNGENSGRNNRKTTRASSAQCGG